METRTIGRIGRVRRARWLAAAGTLITAGSLAVTATSVSAHTAPIVADCDAVRVSLTDYDAEGVNSVTVYIDGSSRGTTTFGTSTAATHPFADPTIAHTWRVVVNAWDDPTGSNGWSFDTGTRTIGVCAEPTTPTTAVAPTTAPPDTAGTVPGPVTPSTNATVASVVVTTSPAAGPATTAIVAQAAPTTIVAPPTTASTATTGVTGFAGTLPVTGDAPWRAAGIALLAFGFGILLVVATRRPAAS